jgi:hypothetical protein
MGKPQEAQEKEENPGHHPYVKSGDRQEMSGSRPSE